jgi:RNA polymerase sigma factor (sigma-70 family)
MVNGQLRTLLNHLHRKRARQDAGGLTDGQLLERFATERQEAAFETLVWRHGTMVHNVCRRVLGDGPDAEDAFQATFLVLVRRAAAIRDREAVASWLYKVAYRVALRVRATAAKGPVCGLPEAEPPARGDGDDVVWRDLRPVLDDEVSRLPEKYRRAVVLCYLSGQTTAEAARQLGCARGTVLSRLAWARERLRSRLVRRGVALSAAGLATFLARDATATVPGAVVASTVKAALWYAAGNTATAGIVSERAVSLTEGVLHAMFLNKVKLVLLVALVLVVLGAGLGLWNRPSATADPVERRREEAPQAGRKTAEEPLPQARAYAVPQEVQRPLGTWEREFGPYHFTLRIEEDHLYGTLTGLEADKGRKLTVQLDADYSVTRDGLLYGVITGVDVPDGDKDADKLQDLQDLDAYSDQPFSMRYRLDGNTLTLKNLKLGLTTKEEDTKEIRLILGRYKKKARAAKEEDR